MIARTLVAPASLRRLCTLTRLLQTNIVDSERPPVPAKGKKTFFGYAPSYIQTHQIRDYEMERLRIIPKLPTFYGGNPNHDENMFNLNALISKHRNLPTRTIDERDAKEFKFVSFEEYRKRSQSGTRLKIGHHKELIDALNRLRSIEHELLPREVIETLNAYSSRIENSQKSVEKQVKQLDEFGRANTEGKRKRAVAEISMVRGEGDILVNGVPLTEFFVRDMDREKLLYPFKVVSQEGQYNVFITTKGGGISGQAEAAMYGISKALVVFNPLLKPRLRLAGLMTRDARKVERKKPGKVKARKSPTWVKR